jgi:hypothetical protein
MIDLDSLPTTRAEMADRSVEFPRLEPDSPDECPCSLAEVMRYLAVEGGTVKPHLIFGRTAMVGDVSFWLWGYVDEGKTYFVDVGARGGQKTICVGSGEGLTPEQYLARRSPRRWGN